MTVIQKYFASKKLFLVWACFISSLTIFAQEKPVEVSVNILPPYSVFMSDYLNPASNKISANLLFTDYNEVSWDVRLRITIQSNSVLLTTKENFRPTEPITLYPGVLNRIADEDFLEYFDYNNLNISGTTISELGTRGKLPEGYYTICIEVFDYVSDKSLSNSFCTNVHLQLGAPPIAISPSDAQVIPPSADQNILFQWQAATTMSVGDPTNIIYSVSIYELLDNSFDPKNAINNNQVEKIFESDYSVSTIFRYDITNPPLERGKIYIYTIHVTDLDETGMFKNDGYSEPYWFYYGYPEGGNISIITPENNHCFTKHEPGIFRWQPADNLVPGENLYYTLKIVLKNGLDAETAIETQDAWMEKSTNMGSSHVQKSLSLDYPLIPLENYAWQVTAYTVDQTVAKSEVYSFVGPPVVEFFYAANKIITVTQTTNGSLSNFSGIGTMVIDTEGTIEEVVFNNLGLVLNSGKYIMEAGEITDKINSLTSIEFLALDSVNNDAIFIPDSIKLTRYNCFINGTFQYNFPHPINGAGPGKVSSQQKWVNYNELKISGDVQVTGSVYELLSPYNFKLKLWETSHIAISSNKFRFYLKGEVILPPSVRNDTSLVSIFFCDVNNLTYFNSCTSLPSEELDLIAQTGFKLRPVNATIDLDNTKSPEKFASQPSWKGVFYNQFNIESGLLLDDQNQLQLNDFMQQTFIQDENTSAWITAQGLTFRIENSFGNEMAKFNQFPSLLTEFLIDISNNTFNEGYIKGKMKIPLFSETEFYNYTVPITANGFNDGYLDLNLENQTIVFNPEGGDQVIHITIKRAVFSAKERLDLVVDLEWPSVNLTMQNVDNLKLWGNYNIGFVIPNGKVNLSQQSIGSLKDFQITSNVIGCGRSDGFYAFGTVAEVVLSDDISGPDGAPQINLYSISENSLLPEQPNYQGENPTEYTNNDDVFQMEIDSLNNQLESIENLNTSLLGLIYDDESEFENDTVNEYTAYEIESIINYQDTVQTENVIEVNGELSSAFSNFQVIIPEELAVIFEGIRNFSINANNSQKGVIVEELEEFMKLYAKSLVDSATYRAEQFITTKTESLNNIIISKTDSIKLATNSFVSSKINNLLTPLEAQLSALAENEYFDASVIVSEVMESAKINITNEINTSINNSIDNNITIPCTSYINEHIRDNVIENIVHNITENLYVLIDSGVSSFNLDVGQMLTDVGNEMIDNIHLDKAGETAFSLAEDAVNGIDLNNIYSNIKTDLMSKLANSIDQLAINTLNQINDISEQMIGASIGSLASNVSIDFTDIGSKIQEGDLSGIIKIDPTNISVQTAIVDFVGTINLKNDDPLFGDVWMGDIDFLIKVPDKENGFSLRGVYMNGKMDNYSYWFCQIEPGGNQTQPGGPLTTDAKPLSTPLVLGPVKLMGASGRLYKHMSVSGEYGSTIIPDNSVNYGASLSLVLFDTPNNGKNFRIGAQSQVVVSASGDYIIDFDGNIQLKGKNPQINSIDQTAMTMGDIELNYNSAEKHFIGNASVVSGGPELCLDANLAMDIKPSAWSVAIGSPEQRIVVVPGCAGWSPTGWLILDQNKVDLGLGLMYSANASSPWIGISNYNVSFFAGFEVAAGISAIIAYNPKIKIQEAGLWAEASATIGANWTKDNGNSGTWTLAEAYLAGYAKVVFDPSPTTIEGGLSGYVRILCIEKGFELEFEHTL